MPGKSLYGKVYRDLIWWVGGERRSEVGRVRVFVCAFVRRGGKEGEREREREGEGGRQRWQLTKAENAILRQQRILL